MNIEALGRFLDEDDFFDLLLSNGMVMLSFIGIIKFIQFTMRSFGVKVLGLTEVEVDVGIEVLLYSWRLM